jgi:hypothetical protein
MSVTYTPDRRTAPRLPCAGNVEITFQDPVATTIQAELVENSSVGFRAVHGCKELSAGLEVQYFRNAHSGRARVMWTHLRDGQRISGFLIL